MGNLAFRRTKEGRPVGSFSDAAFEAICVGVLHNLVRWQKKNSGEALKKLVTAMWDQPDFKKNTGAGVRGTTRLVKLIPFSKKYFA